MTGDRFAPRFSVEVNGVGVGADAAAAVSQLTVTSEPDTLDHCVLTLANPYPEMRWTHEPRDADVFKEGNGLVVSLGYGKQLQPMFDGEITAISRRFPSPGHRRSASRPIPACTACAGRRRPGRSSA